MCLINAIRILNIEVVTDLNSPLLISQKSTNAMNHMDNSPAICDIFSTGCRINGETEIQELNDDCLMHIFSYIPRGDHFVLEKVCRRWEIVSRLTWHTLKRFNLMKSTWGDNSTYENLRDLRIVTLEKVLYRCGSFLTHVDCSERSEFLEEISGKVISVFAKYCTNLQDINLINALSFEIPAAARNPIYERELSKLFLNNKKLRCVRLSNTVITGKCLLNLSEDSLETLAIINGPNISSFHIEEAVKKLQKLHTLILKATNHLSFKTFDAISSCAKSLKELDFSEMFQDDRPIIYELLHCEEFLNLEILDIRANDLINQAMEVIGKKCKELKELNISDNYVITNEGLAHIVSLPKLQNLDISHIHNITDEILTDMPNLRKLECINNKNVGNQGLCHLIKKAHNLELLDIRYCLNVSNELAEVAIEATKNRINNVTLKMYVFMTGIDIEDITTVASPYLWLCKKCED